MALQEAKEQIYTVNTLAAYNKHSFKNPLSLHAFSPTLVPPQPQQSASAANRVTINNYYRKNMLAYLLETVQPEALVVMRLLKLILLLPCLALVEADVLESVTICVRFKITHFSFNFLLLESRNLCVQLHCPLTFVVVLVI